MSQVAFPGETAGHSGPVNAACETPVLRWVQKDLPQPEAGVTWSLPKSGG